MPIVLAASTSFSKTSLKLEPGQILKDASVEAHPNNGGKPYTEAELLSVVAEYDAVIVGADTVTAPVIQKGGKLKILAKNGVGIDNIDLDAASRAGIWVTIAPAAEQTVADSAFALMLALARHIIPGDAAVRRGEWPRLMGPCIWNKKLGIVGLGRIGRAVVARAKGFSMEIYGYDPFADKAFCAQNGVKLVDLDTLFHECDIITLHAPLTDSTRHVVNDRTLGLMKPTAYVINAARGGLVDEDALYRALKEERIAGAGIDCFTQEPPKKDSPLLKAANTVFTPHTAGYSPEANLKTGIQVAESVVAALRGEVPPNVVNAEQMKKLGVTPRGIRK